VLQSHALLACRHALRPETAGIFLVWLNQALLQLHCKAPCWVLQQILLVLVLLLAVLPMDLRDCGMRKLITHVSPCQLLQACRNDRGRLQLTAAAAAGTLMEAHSKSTRRGKQVYKKINTQYVHKANV
jgi:hypothetical protein